MAATGDVTGDKNAEVFVVTACEASTSSWPQVLSVYNGLPGAAGPERLATLLTYDDGTDARGLRQIAVAVNGPLVTTYAEGYDDTDGNAYRSWWVVDQFCFDGTGFVRGPRKVALADGDPEDIDDTAMPCS